MNLNNSENRGQKTENRLGKAIKGVKDLKVYNLAYQLAMEVFGITKRFPKEEVYSVRKPRVSTRGKISRVHTGYKAPCELSNGVYSLTDQIRRSSRSVAINIKEGFAKRKYEQVFIRQMNDALGSSEETRGWLDFARDCGYISKEEHEKLDKQYDEVNAMLYTLMNVWQNFSGI